MCFESFGAALYNNPGNDISLSLANHLTPIGNIVTNISNIFCASLGICAEIGEDGNSLKLYSSRFWSKDDMMNILYESVCGKSLHSYIIEQGLTSMAAINLGQHYVAYFYAQDLYNSQHYPNPVESCKESATGEAEIIYKNLLIKEGEEVDLEDEQIKDLQKQRLKLFSSEDQVKCANEICNLYKKSHQLPDNWTIRALKDEDGDICTALRQNYKRETHNGKEVDASKSWVYVYGAGPNSIWAPGMKNPDHLDKEVRHEMESFLQWMGAEPTEKPHQYNLPGSKEFNKELKEQQKKEKEAAKEAEEKDKEEKEKEKKTEKESEEKKDDKSSNGIHGTVEIPSVI